MTLEGAISQLKRCCLFSALTETQISQELLPLLQYRTVAKGQFLLFPREQAEYFGILCRGRIHLLHIFTDGREGILEVLQEGELFGADLICTPSRSAPYHAVAVEQTRLLCLPGDLLSRLSPAVYREVGQGFLHYIANCNIQKEYRLAILSQKGLRERILTYLTMQAGKRRTKSFTIPFSREELASFLCVNRSALSHELSLMQQEGLLQLRKNHFTLLHSGEEGI